jgi:hypothetical protein
MNNKALLRFGRCGGLSSFYTLLILLGVWALAIESKAEVSKPYVGRWERIMDSGNRETVEFTSDGRFSYDSYAGVLRGTYVEESPGILRIKAKGERLLFGATSGDARAEYEMEGSCLIVTTENGKSDKYFPVIDSDSEPAQESTPEPTPDPTPAIEEARWPDGRILVHPDHFVKTHVINVAETDTLNLRAGPGTRFDVVTQIPHDARDVSAFDQDQVWDGDTWWYPVEWNAFRGYIGRSHLFMQIECPSRSGRQCSPSRKRAVSMRG